MKYILIYYYHDTYVSYFNNYEDMKKEYWILKTNYRNDSDFHIKGFKISSEIDFDTD